MTSVSTSSFCTVLGACGAADGHKLLDEDEVNNADCCIARIAQLLDSGQFSDVTLIVDNRRYRCHRLVLATASSVLE